MIVNMLRFSFKDGTTEEEKAEVLAAMRRTASLGSTVFGVVGQDIGNPEDGYTHTYCVGIPDLDAMERYMNDPVLLTGDDVVFPHIRRMGAVRATDDTDPEFQEKVAAIHKARVARNPEWARQMEAIPETRF